MHTHTLNSNSSTTTEPTRRLRRAGAAFTALLTVALLTGCGADRTGEAAGSVEQGAGTATEQPSIPGVGAPIIMDETQLHAVVQLGRDSVVFALEDPTSWTAVLDPANAGTFIPGTEADGYVTNPALELTSIGDVTATLTNSTGRSIAFTFTVISPTSEFESISRVTSQFAANLIGATEAAATEEIAANGLSFRISSRDGESFPMTKDYSPRRLNLDIVDGVVVGALIG